MRTPIAFSLAALTAWVVSLTIAAPASAADPPTFAAVYPVGRTAWVELARLEDAPVRGPVVTLGDDFFHAYRRPIRGARPLGTSVRLVGAHGETCDGTLGRPAVLGLYYGDEGFGGDPMWIRAAPVRGCGPEGFAVAVTQIGATTLARDVTEQRTVPQLLAQAQARATLAASADWLEARADWAATYTDEPVVTTDRAFALGDSVWALAADGITAECGTALAARVLVHRAPDGRMAVVPFPGTAQESLESWGDLDGDGNVEMVLAGSFGGARRIVRVAHDGVATQVWSSDGIPFFGCPC